MKWFKEHKLFTVVGGIVLALCLVIVISYATAGGTTFVGRGIQSVASIIQKPISAVTGGVSKTVSGIFSFKEIQAENKKLKEENEALRAENKDLKLTHQELADLESLSAAFQFEPYKAGYQLVATNIIGIDLSNPYVVFTIDAGAEKNIKLNDIVVNGSGLVGKVHEVGDGWAKVVSIISENNNISFKTLRDPAITGILQGNGKDKLEGYLMSENSRIIKGDILITTGIGIYPAGVEIGKVTKVDYDDNRQLKTVVVEPVVKFNIMQKVAVYI